MHFQFDPDIEHFRAEVRRFIDENLPPEMRARGLRGYHETKDDVQRWTRILHARGWAAPNWPQEYGGTGWTPLQQLVFDEECCLAGAPPRPAGGLLLAGPVIYSFGSDAQKQRHLPPILRGEAWWGQCFSEPNAGSDLASLKTTAVLDGEHYVVNGQKTWTTQGQFAEWFFALVRTDPAVRPQAGISFLLIDAKSPGIRLRPIISIDGAHSLNEVFFDNVRVPRENLVGEPGAGWRYAKYLLENERTVSAEVPRNKRMFARLLQLASTPRPGGRPLLEDPVFAARVAESGVELLALEFMTLRALSEHEHGSESAQPWSAGSILHVRGSELQQTLGELMVEALGTSGRVFYPEYSEELPQDYPPGSVDAHGVVADFLYRRATTIYGGSNEIQRTLIARAALGALS